MRIGTPGFVPSRLAEGREVRGLSQTSLAELTGIKAQSISHYEQGRQSPSPQALALLCTALDLPERFFLRPSPALRKEGVFFRSAPQARAARHQAEARLCWAKEIAAYLRRFVEYPLLRLPSFTVGGAADIEAAADEVRCALGFGQGPIEDLLGGVEQAGCIVTRFEGLEAALQPSFSQWDGDTAYIVLNANERRPSWLRYAAAHELGHLVLHRGISGEAMDAPDAHRSMERDADRFARAFLMPEQAFRREVWTPTVNALLTLKREWQCPLTAMVTRCGELGIFDADQWRRALSNLSRRGWKVTEPREEVNAGDSPGMLARSVCLVVENGLKDRHGLVADLGMRAADVEEICGLPPGYLAGARTLPALKLRAVNLEDFGPAAATAYPS